MKRSAASWFALLFLVAEVAAPLSLARGEGVPSPTTVESVDMFDAMKSGSIDATFVAKNSKRGRIIMQNKTDKPLSVDIPDAFIGVPLAQMGGMGGGMGGMGGGMMGGGQQNVGGGGGGGGRGGGGRGGGGGGRGGGGRGGFSIPPEKTIRVDVPLLCLDHGKREPSSSKPYAILPIENVIKDPAVIEVVAAYANGDLPTGAAQAAVWHMNSEVSFQELSQKLTGTVRTRVREPYFSQDEIQTAMAIVTEARELTAGETVEPRDFPMPGEEQAQEVVEEAASPGEEVPAAEQNDAAEEATETEPEKTEPVAEPAAEKAAEKADEAKDA
jgi:hypothetical protein